MLSEKEALIRPAGQGQSEPNQFPTLHAPERNDSFLLWYRSPIKNFCYAVCKRYRSKIICLVVILVIGFILFKFVYSAPNYLTMNWIKPKLRLYPPIKIVNVIGSVNTSSLNSSLFTMEGSKLKPLKDHGPTLVKYPGIT